MSTCGAAADDSGGGGASKKRGISVQGRLRVGLHVCVRGREACWKFQNGLRLQDTLSSLAPSHGLASLVACLHVPQIVAMMDPEGGEEKLRLHLLYPQHCAWAMENALRFDHGDGGGGGETLQWMLRSPAMRTRMLRAYTGDATETMSATRCMATAMQHGRWEWVRGVTHMVHVQLRTKRACQAFALLCLGAAARAGLDDAHMRWYESPESNYGLPELISGYTRAAMLRDVAAGGRVDLFERWTTLALGDGGAAGQVMGLTASGNTDVTGGGGPWGLRPQDMQHFHTGVAQVLNSDEHQCEAIMAAAACAQLPMLQYLEQTYPFRGRGVLYQGQRVDELVFDTSARCGALAVLEWLHAPPRPVSGTGTGNAMRWAAAQGHFDCVRWLYEVAHLDCGDGSSHSSSSTGIVTGATAVRNTIAHCIDHRGDVRCIEYLLLHGLAEVEEMALVHAATATNLDPQLLHILCANTTQACFDRALRSATLATRPEGQDLLLDAWARVHAIDRIDDFVPF